VSCSNGSGQSPTIAQIHSIFTILETFGIFAFNDYCAITQVSKIAKIPQLTVYEHLPYNAQLWKAQ